MVWSGQTGECGDPTVHTCYPPAVNYSPLYFLINGVSFDRTNFAASSLSILRRHHASRRRPAACCCASSTPACACTCRPSVGARHDAAGRGRQQAARHSPGAERGVPRRRQDLRRDDPAEARPAGTYTAATYAGLRPRAGLSTNNQRDGGMQAYIKVAGGASGVGVHGIAGARARITAVDLGAVGQDLRLLQRA